MAEKTKVAPKTKKAKGVLIPNPMAKANPPTNKHAMLLEFMRPEFECNVRRSLEEYNFRTKAIKDLREVGRLDIVLTIQRKPLSGTGEEFQGCMPSERFHSPNFVALTKRDGIPECMILAELSCGVEMSNIYFKEPTNLNTFKIGKALTDIIFKNYLGG